MLFFPPLSHNTTVGNANSTKCKSALYFLLLGPVSQVLATLLNAFFNVWVETFLLSSQLRVFAI